ncbi:integral membrane protein (putative) [Secundilactobacillus silagincola]|uniref:Integral membrane protein (Putative) n=1 Tax=Secundilactobacillus silagincola TaxID=1714681 RepID=A0A1Z5H5E5_9LACO|nr:zinc ribbon domain-containing protein [Secundilactobacillus silagincola]GAT18391.1 integral membrane protein (putative) [Secundilactobacillus silagincola]
MEKRYCINCGKELPNEAEFCLYCGAKQPPVKIDASNTEQQQDQSVESSAPQSSDHQEKTDTSSNNLTKASLPAPEKKRKSKKAKRKTKRIWAILATLAVLFIALAVYGNHHSSSATGTATAYNNSSSDSSSDDTDDSSDYDDSDYADDSSDSEDSEDTGDFTNEPVAGISATDYDATEAAGNNYSYGELLKSDDYKGESYNITNAQVLQANESGSATELLVYTDDYADEIFTVYYPDTTEAVKDDYVTVKGVLGGREEYDTQSGGSNTVPTIVAQDVSVTGQGS